METVDNRPKKENFEYLLKNSPPDKWYYFIYKN
jgi:hypothetical protein